MTSPPVATYRSSMMALAARDPSRELAARPAATAAIESTCTRCHAPGATSDLAGQGQHVTFAMLTSNTSAEAELARDGRESGGGGGGRRHRHRFHDPMMDGLELVRALKSRPEWRSIPVVMMPSP